MKREGGIKEMMLLDLVIPDDVQKIFLEFFTTTQRKSLPEYLDQQLRKRDSKALKKYVGLRESIMDIETQQVSYGDVDKDSYLVLTLLDIFRSVLRKRIK